jgi:hypothetical protein
MSQSDGQSTARRQLAPPRHRPLEVDSMGKTSPLNKGDTGAFPRAGGVLGGAEHSAIEHGH